MIKEANLCTAFFPMGAGGSNLQRTIGLKAPLPRALGEPALLPHEPDTSLPRSAAQYSAEEVFDFRRRPIRFPRRMRALKSSSDFRSRLYCDFHVSNNSDDAGDGDKPSGAHTSNGDGNAAGG